MYGNAYIENNGQENKLTANEDPQKLAAFEARIAAGDKIEPHDWMPAEYRKQLIRMIEQHAHSEIVGPTGGEVSISVSNHAVGCVCDRQSVCRINQHLTCIIT